MIDTKNSINNAIIGGVIMSLSSSLHLLLKGKITGMSGVIFNIIHKEDFRYNFCFFLGMIFISNITKSYYSNFFEAFNKYTYDLSTLGFIISGFLTGFGAKLGNGCTSGHGVCGLPRFSKRSFVAICLFMLFGISTATLRSNYSFFFNDKKITGESMKYWKSLNSKINHTILSFVSFSIFALMIILELIKKNFKKFRDLLIAFGIGSGFGYGLIESGMVKRHSVVRFLTISEKWDKTLIFVLGSAVGLNVILFNLILSRKAPLIDLKFHLPVKKKVDLKLIIGSSIFGIGWGITGICPGPAILGLFNYFPQSFIFFGMVIFGEICGFHFSNLLEKNSNKKIKLK